MLLVVFVVAKVMGPNLGQALRGDAGANALVATGGSAEAAAFLRASRLAAAVPLPPVLAESRQDVAPPPAKAIRHAVGGPVVDGTWQGKSKTKKKKER